MDGIEITVQTTAKVKVRYLKAKCGVRYWEDATVNGIEDTEGDMIPMRNGNAWCPTIYLMTGCIVHWPQGTTADIHYKVCDDGEYSLQANDYRIIKTIAGYVPSIMCPQGGGYGDYVIMKIDENGKIDKFKSNLSEFTEEA